MPRLPNMATLLLSLVRIGPLSALSEDCTVLSYAITAFRLFLNESTSICPLISNGISCGYVTISDTPLQLTVLQKNNSFIVKRAPGRRIFSKESVGPSFRHSVYRGSLAGRETLSTSIHKSILVSLMLRLASCVTFPSM